MRQLSEKVLLHANLGHEHDELASVDGARDKNLWLVRLRWFALGTQLICAYLGLRYQLLARADLLIFLTIVGALFLMNLWLKIGISRYPNRFGIKMVFGQMAIDLVALSLLLALSGGCSNPFFPLIYLHSALGPLVLGLHWSKPYLLLILACLSAVCVNSQPMVHAMNGMMLPRQLLLLAELIVTIVIWSLTYWFTIAVEGLRQEMSKIQKQKDRADNLRVLGAMAASFSHEFSTPLNTAKIRLARLARRHHGLGDDPDLKASEQAINQCERILRELFESDRRIGSSALDAIDLVRFVQGISERWRAHNPDHAVRFSTDGSTQTLVCRAPQLVLARSLVDLLDNAAESCAAQPSEIEVKVASIGAHAMISVSDRGEGVSKFVKERLGDPFFSTKPDGIGLGLYSVKALMEALGGALRIDDRTHGGTTVVMTLPLIASTT